MDHTHTNAVVKLARQSLFFLCRLNRFGMGSRILCNFYQYTIENILAAAIIAWNGSSSEQECNAIHRVVRAAEHIIRSKVSTIQDVSTQRTSRKTLSIIRDPSHKLFTLLPSNRRYQGIQTRNQRGFLSSSYQDAELHHYLGYQIGH